MKYVSVDEGNLLQIQKCSAQKVIHLKIDAPVILLCNLSTTLVNGLRGTVESLNHDSVNVYFPSVKRRIQLTQFNFAVYDATLQKDVGSRRQIPLRLAYALTVHKAQGMTISRLHVDCRNMCQAGQIGVAVGRATLKVGLRISNFSKRQLRPHQKEVLDFDMRPSRRSLENLECCRQFQISDVVLEPATMTIPLLSTIAPEEEETIEDMDTGDIVSDDLLLQAELCSQSTDAQNNVVAIALPEEICVSDHIRKILADNEHAVTKTQVEINDMYQYMLQHPVETNLFSCHVWNNLSQLFAKYSETTLSNKNATEFYSKVYLYLQSKSYQSSVQAAFACDVPKGCHFNAALHIVKYLRELFISLAAKGIRERPIVSIQQASVGSDAGKGKIRYIGGWCVATLKYRLKQYVLANMYAFGSQDKVSEVKQEIAYIEQLVSTERELEQHSCEPSSLKETARKQNVKSSLTNITDNAYHFFLSLDTKIRQVESYQYAQIHGEDMYKRIRESLQCDCNLWNMWFDLLKCEEKVDEVPARKLFDEVVQKFLRMSCAQFRRDFLQDLKLKKEEAHRKQIQMKQGKSGCVSKWNFASIVQDVTLNKISSHRRLQAELLQNKNHLIDGPFSKEHLTKLSKSYGLSVTGRSTKKTLAATLSLTIPSVEGVIHPFFLSDGPLRDMSSDHIDTQSAQASKRSKTVEFPCGVCRKECKMNTVQCDQCEKWYHGKCVHVNIASVTDDEEWLCPDCKSSDL